MLLSDMSYIEYTALSLKPFSCKLVSCISGNILTNTLHPASLSSMDLFRSYLLRDNSSHFNLRHSVLVYCLLYHVNITTHFSQYRVLTHVTIFDYHNICRCYGSRTTPPWTNPPGRLPPGRFPLGQFPPGQFPTLTIAPQTIPTRTIANHDNCPRRIPTPENSQP